MVLKDWRPKSQLPALALIQNVALAKSLHLFGVQFHPVQIKDDNAIEIHQDLLTHIITSVKGKVLVTWLLV